MVRTRRFHEGLDELKIQVEVMSIRVGEALDGATEILRGGDADLAVGLAAADDAVDAMAVSLTEKCHELLLLESPVAGDLRLVLSTLRAVSELERIGDLCLRVGNHVTDQALLAAHPAVFQVLVELSGNVRARYATVTEAWAAEDIDALEPLEAAPPLEVFALPLMEHVLDLQGPDAARVAVAALTVGRAYDRIGDHTSILAARLRYLLTGDPQHLADEVL